jgi:hypothetical protein
VSCFGDSWTYLIDAETIAMIQNPQVAAPEVISDDVAMDITGASGGFFCLSIARP